MSLESFIGFEGGEGMSEAAFEAFKEKMREAAAQIAAILKEEKRQRKKEDELLKILLKFVKKSQNKELVLLISRALEQNIPANFILAIIILGNEEVKTEVGEFLMLNIGKEENSEAGGSSMPESRALTFFREDETLPLKLKIELDDWMKTMLLQGQENPQKLLKNAYDIEYIELPEEESSFGDKRYKKKQSIKLALTQLAAYVVREFMEKHGFPISFEQIKNFSEFIIKGILQKVEEAYTGRKLLA